MPARCLRYMHVYICKHSERARGPRTPSAWLLHVAPSHHLRRLFSPLAVEGKDAAQQPHRMALLPSPCRLFVRVHQLASRSRAATRQLEQHAE
jgi:hypothetical protein